MPSSYEYLQLLAPHISNELVISNIAGLSMEWMDLKHRDGNLYQVYMSGATAVALGLALGLPKRKVISLDGDGSILMALSLLPVIGQQNPDNLTIFIFDNELYEATGNVPSATAGKTDLVKIAQGSGIGNVSLVEDLKEFKEAISKADKLKGTKLVVVKALSPRKPRPSLKVAYGGIENKYRFVRYIEETENIKILRPQMG